MASDRSPLFLPGVVALMVVLAIIASHMAGLRTPLTPTLESLEVRLGLAD
jgi:hypothetical protein